MKRYIKEDNMRDIDKDEFKLFPWWLILIGIIFTAIVFAWAYININA